MGKRRYGYRQVQKALRGARGAGPASNDGEMMVAVRRFLEALQRAVFMSGLLPSLLAEPFRGHVQGLYDVRHAKAGVLIADGIEMLSQLRPQERYALVSLFVLGESLGTAAKNCGIDSRVLSNAALSGAAVLYGHMVGNGYA